MPGRPLDGAEPLVRLENIYDLVHTLWFAHLRSFGEQ
jgi:hypothetical protein